MKKIYADNSRFIGNRPLVRVKLLIGSVMASQGLQRG